MTARIEPTWHRGMYGCPQDMYGASVVLPLVAELEAATRRLAEVDALAQEQWAVRMNLPGAERPFYEMQRDRESCQRFIDNPPMWHRRDVWGDLVVVSRTVSETEWRAVA